MTQPPFETRELRAKLLEYLNQKVVDPITGAQRAIGSYKFGVYAFFDYDKEPIYVGQTAEGIKSGRAVSDLAAKVGVDMPITNAVVGVLEGKLTVDDLGPLLLARQLKSEGD